MTPNSMMHPSPGQEKVLSLMDSTSGFSDGSGKSYGKHNVYIWQLFPVNDLLICPTESTESNYKF